MKELAQRINNILSPFGRNEKLAAAFTESIEQIIKVTAYQERYGLADVILLLKEAPSSIPKVDIAVNSSLNQNPCTDYTHFLQ